MRPARQNLHATQATLEVQVSSPDLSRDLENFVHVVSAIKWRRIKLSFYGRKEVKMNLGWKMTSVFQYYF